MTVNLEIPTVRKSGREESLSAIGSNATTRLKVIDDIQQVRDCGLLGCDNRMLMSVKG